MFLAWVKIKTEPLISTWNKNTLSLELLAAPLLIQIFVPWVTQGDSLDFKASAFLGKKQTNHDEMLSFWGGRISVVLGSLFVPFWTNVKQSMQQKGHIGQEQPLQRRRKSCFKVRTLFFNGNKVAATFSITVLYEQSALQRLTNVEGSLLSWSLSLWQWVFWVAENIFYI